jgi:hypothetical protein
MTTNRLYESATKFDLRIPNEVEDYRELCSEKFRIGTHRDLGQLVLPLPGIV